MSGTVIVVTSGKGGVGKTTATASIGAALAMMGPSVVLVDADIGLRNLDLVLGLEGRIFHNLVDVVDGVVDAQKALIRHKDIKNLALLPAAQSRDKTAVTPEKMRAVAEELKAAYDFVIIDCPAGIEQGFKNAVAGAEKAIVVTTPEMSAVRDADRIIGMLEHEGITDPWLIINRIRFDMVKKHDMLDVDDVLEHLKIKLLGVIPDDEAIIVATNKGVPVVMDERSKSGRAFRDVAARIMGEDVPMAAAAEEDDWFTRIIRWFARARG